MMCERLIENRLLITVDQFWEFKQVAMTSRSAAVALAVRPQFPTVCVSAYHACVDYG